MDHAQRLFHMVNTQCHLAFLQYPFYLPIILKEKHHAFQIKYSQEWLYQWQPNCCKPAGMERTLLPKKMTRKHKEAEHALLKWDLKPLGVDIGAYKTCKIQFLTIHFRHQPAKEMPAKERKQKEKPLRWWKGTERKTKWNWAPLTSSKWAWKLENNSIQGKRKDKGKERGLSI